MSFRSKKTILREGPGEYVSGVWTPGARETLDIYASVQPVSSMRDVQVLPEGRHYSDFVKVYTDQRLLLIDDGETGQCDIIVSNGYGYELCELSPNQSNVINHFKYIAVKVLKFTSVEDWLSGVLKRP